jgi:uncharacterized membrane protein YgdD (TMEM256/DUF423 family)
MTNAPTRIAIAIAGLMGAAGVALAAAAAHGGDAARLGPASSMLLFHASAVLAALALIERRVSHPLVTGIAVTGLLLGSTLFSGDLTVRHYFYQALFPMAAPIGGTLLIASWLALAVAALVPRRA